MDRHAICRVCEVDYRSQDDLLELAKCAVFRHYSYRVELIGGSVKVDIGHVLQSLRVQPLNSVMDGKRKVGVIPEEWE